MLCGISSGLAERISRLEQDLQRLALASGSDLGALDLPPADAELIARTLAFDDRGPAARRLWTLLREQLSTTPGAVASAALTSRTLGPRRGPRARRRERSVAKPCVGTQSRYDYTVNLRC